jgi:prevent-host-death family protein
MSQIGVFEAKNRLSALLDDVEAGAEITITRRGRPVARLVPVLPALGTERARQAAQGIRALARRMAHAPADWPEWKQYRDEGRR